MWICFSNAIPEPAPLVMDSVNIEKVAHLSYLEFENLDVISVTET